MVTDESMQVVSIDFIGPLTINRKGHKYICSIVDAHIYGDMVPTCSSDASSVVQAMETTWLPRWGAPQILMGDATQIFNGQWWSDFCEAEAICHIQVPPFFLQRANGVNERLTPSQGGEWVNGLDKAVNIYRNLPHSTMQISPNCALLGMDLPLFGTCHLVPPPDLHVEQFVSPTFSVVALADYIIHSDIHAIVVSSVAIQRTLDQTYHNRRVCPILIVLVI